MNLRQMTVADWVAEFLSNPAAISQLRIVQKRQGAGLPLATWEYNCLVAADHISVAAE